MPILSGIHPVAEALRAGRALERILIAQGAGGPRLQEIIDGARRAQVPVRFEPRSSLDRMSGTSAHQGVIAMGAASKYADLDNAANFPSWLSWMASKIRITWAPSSAPPTRPEREL